MWSLVTRAIDTHILVLAKNLPHGRPSASWGTPRMTPSSSGRKRRLLAESWPLPQQRARDDATGATAVLTAPSWAGVRIGVQAGLRRSAVARPRLPTCAAGLDLCILTWGGGQPDPSEGAQPLYPKGGGSRTPLPTACGPLPPTSLFSGKRAPEPGSPLPQPPPSCTGSARLP